MKPVSTLQTPARRVRHSPGQPKLVSARNGTAIEVATLRGPPRATTAWRRSGIVALALLTVPGSGVSQEATPPPPADSMAIVVGRLTDAASGRPLAGASVYVAGTTAGTITDAEGLFRLDAVPHGVRQISLFHPEWRDVGAPAPWTIVKLPGGIVTTVEWAVTYPPQLGLEHEGLGEPRDVIPIDPLTVVVRSRAVERRRTSGTRLDFLGRAEIEARLERSADVRDLLTTIPALRIRPSPTPDAQFEICIESGRSVPPLHARSNVDERCPTMPLVVVDGIRLTDPVRMLRLLDLDALESIEYVPALQAGARWGTGSMNGVIVITTRTR